MAKRSVGAQAGQRQEEEDAAKRPRLVLDRAARAGMQEDQLLRLQGKHPVRRLGQPVKGGAQARQRIGQSQLHAGQQTKAEAEDKEEKKGRISGPPKLAATHGRHLPTQKLPILSLYSIGEKIARCQRLSRSFAPHSRWTAKYPHLLKRNAQKPSGPEGPLGESSCKKNRGKGSA